MEKMNNRKSFRVDKEQYKKIQVMENTTPEMLKKQREQTIATNELRVRQFQRMIEDKKDQIETKIYREKSENYIDGAKPDFILQNEIEDIEAHIEGLKDVIENTKKAKNDKD